ncbi:copper chaperone PCu(A)C [Thiothrix subterranea]|uniref:Copper chaperone PCu(A)C n=1 Tax=Thiothrix subterranea TaxID=2735563 RepID=A0AA51R5X4_9GAMM|nr:copper chaperone PCu(A)C [Thiothrix subterranea]MDQ5767022.1 copper chaperone PCu(A)C [Thiothrix subterranea]WML88116.1 copper chaperone PCu(A)C [Thiothrix subterranea]
MKRLLHTAALGILLSMTVACQADADKSAAAVPATNTAADSVTVEAPFVRAIPPGQPNSASFMTLVNTSDSDHSVKSAASPVAATVELHTHTNNNGVMEMRQVPQIDVPAKGRTELKPGGLHVMLIGLQQELKVGETAAITLTFEDGSTTTVNAPIQEVMPAKH